jgi:DnaD/phage-associated family protein
MARPQKQTVDYFPHYVTHGKTMFILEQRFKNDGYAFWFKLLETLGGAKGHIIDCSNDGVWEFLQAKTHLDDKTCTEILNKLATLQAIDTELWQEKKIVWCQNFVDGIADVYRNRRIGIPVKPSFYNGKPTDEAVSTTENTQSKGNDNKLNDNRLEESILNNNEKIYTLYGNNIGLITPVTSEELKGLLEEYPAAWVEEAIENAVNNNARSLSYIRGVLLKKRANDKGETPKPKRERVVN